VPSPRPPSAQPRTPVCRRVGVWRGASAQERSARGAPEGSNPPAFVVEYGDSTEAAGRSSSSLFWAPTFPLDALQFHSLHDSLPPEATQGQITDRELSPPAKEEPKMREAPEMLL
jgi:hypothetical protein